MIWKLYEARSDPGFLFLISLLVNVSLVAFYIPNEREQISELIAKTSLLSIRTMQLEQQLNLASISNQASPCSSEVSCSRPAPGGAGGAFFGTASMPATAVSQSVQRIRWIQSMTYFLSRSDKGFSL
jgi:hypothetical protein